MNFHNLIILGMNNQKVNIVEYDNMGHSIEKKDNMYTSFRNNDQSMNNRNNMNNMNNMNDSTDDDAIWLISEEDTKKFASLFNNTKDFGDKLSIKMLHLMCNNAKINPVVLNKILSIMPPLNDGLLNFKYFRVIFQLISKSHLKIEIPDHLPRYLRQQLEHNPIPTQSINANLNKNINPNNQSQQQPQTQIPSRQINQPQSQVQKKPPTEFDFDCGLAPIKPKEVLVENVVPTSINKQQNDSNYMSLNNSNEMINNTNPNVNVNNNQNILNSQNFQNVQNQNVQSHFSKQHSENLKSELIKVHKNILNVLKDKENESAFLNKSLEEDNRILFSLIDEIEKLNRTSQKLDQKNREMNESALELKRRINIEKDKMSMYPEVSKKPEPPKNINVLVPLSNSQNIQPISIFYLILYR